MTLHIILLVDRLSLESENTASTSQILFDTYLSNLDGALREMGVSDLQVPKRMRALGEAFYGRAEAYRSAFKALPEQDELSAVIARTVMGGAPGYDPQSLAAYVARCRGYLQSEKTERLLSASLDWPTP